ncbi:hypothetical protein L2735_17080 [Shewanella olleyana]|uniref:hypothetical protein n=1 Tax=Shewanella olleyana TaxID=135626 RepID=UPI00200F256C|nr:hypothetical protein [Shewanella olleyana]MCL1068489.1 hypothetical protein [Shewanella olleyana]
MPLNQYYIHNMSLFFRTVMLNPTNASLSPAINERKATESLAVNALIATYLGLFTLFMWVEQFRMPYVDMDMVELYWEMFKAAPFSEAETSMREVFFREIERVYIWQWAVFILLPVFTSGIFLFARSKLKRLPMHEAADGGKLTTLGRVLSLFIQSSSHLFMLFVIGYSFFATSAFSQWLIDGAKGSFDFNTLSLFFPIGALVLVWQFIRPFATFYVITIHKK